MTPAIVTLNVLTNDFLTPDRMLQITRVFLILLIGIPLLKIATHLIGKVTRNKFSAPSETLIKRSVYYTGVIIILMTVLNEFGFKLSALLGAAGIFGIAIGFAAQSSISNIISGLFLISEKPFRIDDQVQIGETVGNVISIDLLSIKVRTADNRFVRIPNETMLKSEVINITRFPIRRLNLHLQVAYKNNLNSVIEILNTIAGQETLALNEPAPHIQIEQYALTGIHILFGVWSKQEDIGKLKNALLLKVKDRFEQVDIGIPYTYTTSSAINQVTEVKP